MAKGNPVVLAGLDLGTSTTAITITAVKNAALELLGVGESPSLGVQKGIVTDTESAARSIKQALEKAEKMAGLKIDSVYISHNGASIQVRNCRVENAAAGIPFNSAEGNKTTGLKAPAVAGIPRDEELLQIIPPRVGLPGFTSEARVITARARDLAKMVQSARLAGLQSKGIIYGPLAVAEAVLTPAEREFGTILVDIGAGLTSVSIFDRCLLKETAVFALGGEHFASDLAIGLRTSLSKAQEILWTGSWEFRADNQSAVPHPAADPEDPGTAKSHDQLIRTIIEARAEEIIDLIDESINSFNYPGILPGGVILSGGVSRLNGLALLAEKRLQKLVRVVAAPIGGIVASPAFTGALGLVRYTFRHLNHEEKSFEKSGLKKPAAKLLDWFQVQLNQNKAGHSKNQ